MVAHAKTVALPVGVSPRWSRLRSQARAALAASLLLATSTVDEIDEFMEIVFRQRGWIRCHGRELVILRLGDPETTAVRLTATSRRSADSPTGVRRRPLPSAL
jgi:hypothetical protein